MCRELFLIYPRCGHPMSSMGTIDRCPSYGSNSRVCVNAHGQMYKDWDFHVEDTRTQRYIDGQDYEIRGGWKAEIEQGYKGYCRNCVEGRTEPMDEREKDEFLDGYLGEYMRVHREREKRKNLAEEQARLLEKFAKEKAENEAWTEAD